MARIGYPLRLALGQNTSEYTKQKQRAPSSCLHHNAKEQTLIGSSQNASKESASYVQFAGRYQSHHMHLTTKQ
jgi:hypothetical protein